VLLGGEAAVKERTSGEGGLRREGGGRRKLGSLYSTTRRVTITCEAFFFFLFTFLLLGAVSSVRSFVRPPARPPVGIGVVGIRVVVVVASSLLLLSSLSLSLFTTTLSTISLCV
jgi:hypothetical protein